MADSQTGSTSANFHEGNRSEYLAHYVFSSLGTAIPVSRPEDTGLDLYCTVTKRIGQRIWPQSYYAVQVKSTMDAWQFNSPESVRWLIEHPLPLFLCVVLKKEALLKVYQTTPRFYAWSLPPLPQRLELLPGEGMEGCPSNWIDGTRFGLSAPILEFTVEKALEDEFPAWAKRVLQMWIDVDLDNLRRVQNGVRNFRVPSPYRTNECEVRGWATQGVGHAESEDLAQGAARLKDSLDWVTTQLFKHGDLPGAIRGMLLLRHLYWADFHGPAALTTLARELAEALGKGETRWVHQVIDELGCKFDDWLLKELRDSTKVATVKRLYLGSSGITDETMAHLACAVELRCLYLDDTGITDAGISHLKGLTRLRELHLNGTEATESALVHIRALTELESLGLKGTKVDDEGLRHLAGLQRLKNLYLDNTLITSEGIGHLKGLPSLDTLLLNGTGIDDRALSHLKECPSLRRVQVWGTKVTEEGIEVFKRAKGNVLLVES